MLDSCVQQEFLLLFPLFVWGQVCRVMTWKFVCALQRWLGVMGILHQTDTSEQLPDRMRHGQKVPTAERLLRMATALQQGCHQDCTVSTAAGRWVQKVYGCSHHATFCCGDRRQRPASISYLVCNEGQQGAP